jgi:hypothetical protein
MTRYIKTLFFLLGGLICLGLQTTDARADKRVALIIGNAQYENVPRLRNPGSDASDIADTLRGLGYDVILTLNAKKNDFDRALADFSRKAEGADVALFYYAGHGVQYQQNNYLLPTDIQVQDIRDVKFQAVNNSVVMAALEEAKGVKVLILDACRDNPFSGTKVAVRSAGNMSRGLARIDATTRGMVVLYATSPEAVAQDGAGRNSPFAESLINRLKEPGVEINAMFREVAADVYAKTEQGQLPEFGGNLIGEVYLNPNEGDHMAWDRIRESQDTEDFRKFIKRFPNSPYARDAQIRIDLFERIAVAEQRRRQQDLEEQKRAAEEKAREEARRRDAEKQAAEAKAREDARRREEEARNAAQKEEERRAEEKRQQEAAAAKAKAAEEAARLAREEADRRRAEDARIAAKNEEERKRQEEEARAATEKMKAAQEAERKAKEEADRLAAAKCASESADLDRLSKAGDLAGLEQFGARATCDGMTRAARREARRIETTQARACDADRRALRAAARGGLPDIRAAFGAFTCEAVKTDAQQKIAALESAERETQAGCAADRAAYEALDRGALDSQRKLTDLRALVKCPTVRAAVDEAIDKAQMRARQLQSALVHAGCYDGRVNGEIDEPTRGAVSQFLGRKGMNRAEGRLTDEFIGVVQSQELLVCPGAPPVANTPPEPARPAIIETAPEPRKAIRDRKSVV